MSGGYPTRITRGDLGPEPVNFEPVSDPEQQLDAEIASLAFRTIAGGARTADLAWCLVASDGSLEDHGEAWSPDDEQDPPDTVRNGSAGDYTVTYAASYTDKNGASITTALRAAKVSIQGTTAQIGVAEVQGDGRTVEVRTFTHAGVAADARFLLEVK